MPTVTATSVLDEARGTYLNDASAAKYTNTVLQPMLRTAYEHLRNQLALNDIPVLNEISAAQTITALSTSLSSVPTDMMVPIRIEERTPSSTEIYQPMEQRTWPPATSQTNRLRYWDWREEAVEFLGATADREIRLYYIKDLNPSAITSASTLSTGNARSYLAARIAALVAMFIMRNENLAQAAQGVADEQLSIVIKINVKEKQAMPTRRRPFLGPRRGGFGW